MNLAALPPLREALVQAGIVADKGFGQHFLLDLNICRKIVRLAGPLEGEAVIEVGPGPAGLTRALLEAGAWVIAVEMDARFLPLLEDLATSAPGRLWPVRADALQIDETALVKQFRGPAGGHVVSNLPYNVGTALLIKWLTGPFRPLSMTLMFQKEVADRIVATPGGKDYGRLAVISQSLCRVGTVLDLPARAFTPPPKVASAVVRLNPLPSRPSDQVVDAIQKVAGSAFNQRRKMLRSSLRAMGGEDLCVAAGIDPNLRAEVVPVSGFAALAECWLSRSAPCASPS